MAKKSTYETLRDAVFVVINSTGSCTGKKFLHATIMTEANNYHDKQRITDEEHGHVLDLLDDLDCAL